MTAAGPGGGSSGVTRCFWARSGLDSVADPADDVREGREVAQLEGVVAGDAVVAADRGEDLGLFDGVDAEVGFQVEVDVEQVGRIAGEPGDDADDGVGDLVAGRRGRGRRFGCRFDLDRDGGSSRGRCRRRQRCAGAGVPVLSRIQPMTCVSVGKSRSLRVSSRATP